MGLGLVGCAGLVAGRGDTGSRLQQVLQLIAAARADGVRTGQCLVGEETLKRLGSQAAPAAETREPSVRRGEAPRQYDTYGFSCLYAVANAPV